MNLVAESKTKPTDLRAKMAEEYSYTKKRFDFGRHATFEDTDTRIVGAVPANESQEQEYTPRNPNKITLDNIPMLSEHRVSYTF